MGQLMSWPVMTLFALLRGGTDWGETEEYGDDRSSQDTDGGSACQCDRVYLVAVVTITAGGWMVTQAETSTFDTTTHHL